MIKNCDRWRPFRHGTWVRFIIEAGFQSEKDASEVKFDQVSGLKKILQKVFRASFGPFQVYRDIFVLRLFWILVRFILEAGFQSE